ncbi:uncharacterized protein [Euphorbia lathyris]|uniref:uncharacterized protein n=1 Tax=Euphorbia lathyris TaxID=212925 RepID=UPI003313AAF9
MSSQIESAREVNLISSSDPKPEEKDMDARVQAMWKQMNKGSTNKNIKPTSNKRSSSTMNSSSQKLNDNWRTYLGIAPKNTGNHGKGYQNERNVDKKNEATSNKNQISPSSDKSSQTKSDNWISYLGLATKKTANTKQDALQKESSNAQSATSDEARKIAAAALSAVKDAAAAAAAASGRGKIEIKEVRDFAGQDIEVKKLVDLESREAAENARSSAPSAVDAVLQQIKKKPKLSVLDKTKKDWGEFKDENKGLEVELDAYKKSSNQYLDRVSFLQRADYREYERERDARLAQQTRRRTDMREDNL